MELLDRLKNKLENTGLSRNEIGVYVSLLKIGESTSGQILKDYSMSSGKIYNVLDKLINKGLVSYIIKNNIKFFKAQKPQNILDYLDEEKNKILEKEAEIRKVIPALNVLSNESEDISIEIYEGIEGLKTAIFRFIEEHEHGETEYNFDHFDFGTKGKVPDNLKYISMNYVKIMKKKEIKDKILISTINPITLKEAKKMFEGTDTEFRYMKNQKFASILFAKKRTLIFDYKKPCIVFIRSKVIADSFIRMFESMWELGEKV